MVNPGHLSEDDYILEANNIKMYLVKLFDESMKPLSGDRDFNKMIQIQESEITLLCKWRELIQGMFQNRQDSLYTQYTKNQLEYISLVLKSVLDVRQNILTTNNDLVKHNFNTEDTEVQHVMEDIIYLIILLMDQAKALYLNPSENSTLPKKKSKAKSQYNQCTTKFIELIRKDQSIKSLDIEDDLVMPFLSKIFETSFAISWHLDSIKETSNRDELESLGHFCKLVNSYEITPAQGLIDASNKNWIWAKDILEMVDKHTLRIVFVSDRGKVIRHILSLPSYKKRETSQSVGCSRSGSKRSTLPNRSYFNTIMRKVTCMEPSVDHLKTVYLCLTVSTFAAVISVLSIGIFINNVLYIAILSAFGSLLFFLIVLLTPDLEHSNRGWRMGCLLGFAGFSGIGLTNLFREVYKEDPTLLVTALLETGLIFSCLSACAIFSERGRFLFLGIPLTVFLFTLILISYANVIEESYAVSKALVYLSLFAMCGLVLYDTQVIVERFKNGDKDFIGQTMNVFTDFIGIYRRLLILAVDKQRQLEYRRVGSREDEEYFFGLVTPVAPIHALF
ncbi:hypothetical protein HHI36_015661 [Cryptolaemus montrouzieri]|uniref:Uncharacterized protein n=1 Tax=Cryptolaemus montrouzieri TaxID=559131 RepID=A0ABD2N688_9CUCU